MTPSDDLVRSALVLVDLQPDFLPGGALPVEAGDVVLPGIHRLMSSDAFPLQVATQDWHPPDHASFASSHSGAKAFETIQLHGHDQVLWPDHCVQGTPGAQLHPGLPWDRVAAVIRKGMDPAVDSYSGLRNNWGPGSDRPSTGLAGYLRERGVEHLYVCGLARDYCVRWTVEDAVEEGFRVTLLWELTRSVDPSGDDALRSALTRAGVEVVDGEALPAPPAPPDQGDPEAAGER